MRKTQSGSFRLSALSQAATFVEEPRRKSGCMSGGMRPQRFSSSVKSARTGSAIRTRIHCSFTVTCAIRKFLSSVPCVTMVCCIEVLFSIIFGSVMAFKTRARKSCIGQQELRHPVVRNALGQTAQVKELLRRT